MTNAIGFTVTGGQKIHCEDCEQRIDRALKRLPGVLSVEVSAESQTVFVEFDADGVGDEELRRRLDLLGYQVESGGGVA